MMSEQFELYHFITLVRYYYLSIDNAFGVSKVCMCNNNLKIERNVDEMHLFHLFMMASCWF